VIPTNGQLRAFARSDNPFTVWVRDEDGNVDLEGQTLSVEIRRGANAALTLDATSPSPGEVAFTLSAENVQQRLSLLGVFPVRILADDRVVWTGLLTVLG
jgi:hypothetical protein